LFSISYIKSEFYDPIYTAPKIEAARLQEIEDNKMAKQKLYQNRVNAPSRPTRSINDVMTFLVSAESINRAITFISYDGSADINSDQQKGLDSWMTD
jgi:MoaA/NifB/PqqE/SkfB family radical SAM enzyme